MDTLAEIRRLRERADARRKKLDTALIAIAAEIADLDAAERVFLKLAGAPAEDGSDSGDEPKLTQMILDALHRFPEGATPSGLRVFIASEYNRDVNQNSVYGILNRHSKAGRVVNSNGVWTLKQELPERSPWENLPGRPSGPAGYESAPPAPDLDDEIPF